MGWCGYDTRVITLSITYVSMIKNNTQTAVINNINLRIIYKLDVSYASQHTKVFMLRQYEKETHA